VSFGPDSFQILMLTNAGNFLSWRFFYISFELITLVPVAQLLDRGSTYNWIVLS